MFRNKYLRLYQVPMVDNTLTQFPLHFPDNNHFSDLVRMATYQCWFFQWDSFQIVNEQFSISQIVYCPSFGLVKSQLSGLCRLRIKLSWVRLRGPVIQANGRLTYEDDLRSFQWTPASALSLLTVWSHRGNPGVTRCWEMAFLPAGYIPQC